MANISYISNTQEVTPKESRADTFFYDKKKSISNGDVYFFTPDESAMTTTTGGLMNYDTIWKKTFFHGYPLLQQYIFDDPGYYKVILEALYERFEKAFEMFGKVLIVQLTVNFPREHYVMDHEGFSLFMEQYRDSLARYGVLYLWVAELNSCGKLHYHLYLFINGGRTGLHYFGAPTDANRLWCHALKMVYGIHASASGLIHVGARRSFDTPMNNGMIVNATNTAFRAEAFRICSYAAKVRTKRELPAGLRRFSASILKGVKNAE